MNEQLESVKKMNQLIMAEKVDKVRQKQLKEKKEIFDDYRDNEMEMDTMMEIERIKRVYSEQ